MKYQKKQNANFILQLEKLPSLHLTINLSSIGGTELPGRCQESGMWESYDYTIKDTGGITLTHRFEYVERGKSTAQKQRKAKR
jgi:hypothetical protein